MSGAITQSGTSRLSSAGVFNGASFNVAGTEVISSGRVFKPVSLDVNGTANVIDSSRNASVVSITVNGSYGITSAGLLQAAKECGMAGLWTNRKCSSDRGDD